MQTLTDKRNILIVGQTPDIHIETIQSILKSRGIDSLLLHRGYGDSCSFYIDTNSSRGRVFASDRFYWLDEISAVWWRMKPSSPVEFSGGQGSVEETMKWVEWRHQLRSLSTYTSNAFWINRLSNHYEASYKPTQLFIAQKLGFNIPKTVISNNPNDILELFDNEARVIYKTLSSFIIPPDEIIYTNEIYKKDIEECREQISLAPGIYQEFINKQYELRITLVGHKIFAVKIDSQKTSHTKVDWRRDQLQDMYEFVKLDKNFESMIHKLHKKLGLFYGAYDFVVDNRDKYFFLECNPGGQWLWLENALNLPISKEIASALAEKT